MTTDTQQPHDSKGEESREKLNKDEGQASGLATDRDERISDSLEQHETPLLQQAQLLEQLHNHDGIITQQELHKAWLQQHCGFCNNCNRWIADAGMIKTHILRVHTDIASYINAELHAECKAFKDLLKRDAEFRWCTRKVYGTGRHCSQCPVLFQLVLAHASRHAVSASRETEVPDTWPMPPPATSKHYYCEQPHTDAG